MAARGKILALTGGVGGAKLALGLAAELDDNDLHLLVNTGDDFEHLGLHISPDIDTLLYTLSGRANAAQGWGLEGETFHALDALGDLGAETWFLLGDRDLATHLWRTQQLAAGASLPAVTANLAAAMGVGCAVHPMSADPVRTTVHTVAGDLPFQHYFVRERCAPGVTGFTFAGIDDAAPNPAVLELLGGDALAGIVVCPSNPFVSVDPILQLPGLAAALTAAQAPLALVSPIVAGAALKGPAAKMMTELGVPVTALAVARHYAERYPGLVDYFVIDSSDATLLPHIEALGMAVAVAPTIMRSREDKQRLARTVLELLEND